MPSKVLGAQGLAVRMQVDFGQDASASAMFLKFLKVPCLQLWSHV